MWCPIQPAKHPEVEAVDQGAIEWLDQWGFCENSAERTRVLASSSADFYGRFAPRADADRLVIAVCWVYWGFAFDDARCDEGHLSFAPAEFAELAARTQRALEVPGRCASDDRFLHAVHDLGERFRACATPTQMQRFANSHRAWLSGVQNQVANQARGHMPSLDDYLAMRLHSAGGEPTFAMLEIVNAAEIPSREMNLPVVRALTEMAILTAALDNDRHSFRKELSRGQTDQNIFTVLVRQHPDWPLERVVIEAVALRDRILRLFLRVRRRVMPTAGGALRWYLDDLGHGIRGNAEWGQSVDRYFTASDTSRCPHPAYRPQNSNWAEQPLDCGHQPDSLPSIDWWWNFE